MKYGRGDEAKAERRARILDAALRLGAERGWDHVTVRDIATEVGYTAPIVYQHFAGKEGLLHALVESGFDQLADVLTTATDTTGQDPAESLQALGRAYWRFAFDLAPLYLLMHQLPGVPFGTAATPASARRAFAALRAAVAAANPSLTDAAALDGATDQLWAALHGLAGLTLQNRIKGGRRRARTLLAPLLGRFVEG